MPDEILPYGGATHPNSGYAGSETSRARAEREDADGSTSEHQRTVLSHLVDAGARGMTVVDLRNRTGWHHGRASGALSALHAAGRIVRLTEIRDRCKVYVTPSNVGLRTTEHQGKTSTTVLLDDMADLLSRSIGRGCRHGALAEEGCVQCEASALLRRWDLRK